MWLLDNKVDATPAVGRSKEMLQYVRAVLREDPKYMPLFMASTNFAPSGLDTFLGDTKGTGSGSPTSPFTFDPPLLLK